MSESFASDTRLPCTIRPSPNYGDRKGRQIDSIILHYTDMPDAEAALAVLSDPATEVSSHYLVDADGTLFQLVPEARRAWHAGRSYWHGERDMNSVSVGIEIANAGRNGNLPPFPDVQIEVVIALCRDILERHGVPADRVLGHSDIAPGRKVDPGPRFPWKRLAEEGLGLWPGDFTIKPGVTLGLGATGERVRDLQRALTAWGADVPVTGLYDRQTSVVVSAFQLHFRPSLVSGMADPETWCTIASLLPRRPAT